MQRQMKDWMLALGALLPLLLAGCAGPGAAPPTAGTNGPAASSSSAGVPAGTDAGGRQCRATALPPLAGGTLAWDIACGEEGEAGGQLWSRPAAAPPVGRDDLRRLSDRSDWASQLALKASCQEPQWLPTPLGEAMVQHCQLREGGWPHLSLVLALEGRLYQADGIPAMADPFLAAIAMAAGKPAPAPVLTAALGLGERSFGKGEVTRFDGDRRQGRLANSLENFAAAEASYRRALAMQTRILGPDAPGLGDTLMALALEVSNQGRYEEADGLFDRAEALIQRSFDPALRARLLAYRGYHALAAGRPETALVLAKAASAARRQRVAELEGDDPTGLNRAVLGNLTVARAELIHSLVLEAAIGIRLRQAPLAEAASAEARRIFDRTPGLPSWWQPRLLAQQGMADAMAGRTREGLEKLEAATAASRALFGEGWPVASLLLERGRVAAEAGLNEPALVSFEAAFTIIRSADQPPAQLPLDRIAPYLRAALAVAKAKPTEAPALHAAMFQAVQLVREGAVGQTIGRAAARFATNDPAAAEAVRSQQEAARQRDRLRLDLAAETAKPDGQRSPAREQSLRTELEAASRRADAADQALASRFPDYNRLTRFTTPTGAEVAAALREGEALSLFAFADQGGFGFLLRPQGVTAYAVDMARAELTRQVQGLRRAFVPRDGGLLPFDLAAAHGLYQALYGPVAAEMAGVRRLDLVPGGPLLSLPPALLVTAPAAAGDYAGAAWLARGRAIAVAPSVPAFLSLRRLASRSTAQKPFIGFAAPPFQGAAGRADGMAALAKECRTGGAVDPALLRSLAPLPETADEIRQIGQGLGATPDALLTGAAVTKAALRRASLSDYRVLYFATHGLLPGELRCQAEPGLALAPPSSANPDPADDGLLTASDVATLRLNAELVVLSACNTAGGGQLGGESLSGLAEAFFFAGARNLLVTHWQVPSKPTVTLMTDSFAGLPVAGGDAAAALATAQMRLAASPGTGHPFFWAAFTLIGDGLVPVR
ncbi:CHAT domain-containing tetratricopeptide repeat protein [Niveispirillum sp. BGYR6]|uniref:CHAT domain-containing protein n=1 Tax=Niveispirillum sp. BGYR6 TaxID=2971249 RepID=UPI0022B960E4|nr:CHAT domain-containing tetratricopeptide repeat protein [Niveispirillum sp. BGYR6]MDG5494865.1 CHAT domain-containing protein [Niveispirillum sp. BGYR6]